MAWTPTHGNLCVYIYIYIYIHVVLVIQCVTDINIEINNIIFFSVAQQPKAGFGRLIVEVSRSHTIRHTHTHTHSHAPSITPLHEWSGRRRVSYLHNAQQTHKANIHASGIFEPAIPALKRLQTLFLDRHRTIAFSLCKLKRPSGLRVKTHTAARRGQQLVI